MSPQYFWFHGCWFTIASRPRFAHRTPEFWSRHRVKGCHPTCCSVLTASLDRVSHLWVVLKPKAFIGISIFYRCPGWPNFFCWDLFHMTIVRQYAYFLASCWWTPQDNKTPPFQGTSPMQRKGSRFCIWEGEFRLHSFRKICRYKNYPSATPLTELLVLLDWIRNSDQWQKNLMVKN